MKNQPISLFFFMAWLFSADTWEKLGTLETMVENGFGVYALDLPGFGKSSGKRLRRNKAAEFLKSFIDMLGLRNFVLIGPSMGGGVALLYSIKYPNDLVGLVLIAPAGLDDPLIHDNLDKIEVPVLIFWGENDRVFPLSKGKELEKQLKNAKLIVCRKARHPCYLDQPKIFHQHLISFLKNIYRSND